MELSSEPMRAAKGWGCAIAVLGLLGPAGSAVAQDDDDCDYGQGSYEDDYSEPPPAWSRPGPWVGAGGFYAQENFDENGVDDSGGPIFRAGYRGNDWFGVEFLGEVLAKFQGGDADTGDVDGFSVTINAKAFWPLGRLEPWGMLGLGFLDIDPDKKSRKDDFSFRFATGFDLYLNPHWALYGEVAYMLPTGSVSDYPYGTFGGGILYRF